MSRLEHSSPLRRRVGLTVALLVLLLVALAPRPRAEAGGSGGSLILSFAFAGGGLTGLAQCREVGSFGADQVRVSGLWKDAFALEIFVPAGQPLPCLGASLPESHTIEIFGETADGEVANFPEAAVPWDLSLTIDDSASVPMGSVWLQSVAVGQWNVVWSGGSAGGSPLPGLSLGLRTVASGGDDVDPKDATDDRHRDEEPPVHERTRHEERPHDGPPAHEEPRAEHPADEGGVR